MVGGGGGGGGGGGPQGQFTAKPTDLIFSQTFHLIRMKFYVVMKHFKLRILRLLLIKIFRNKGNNCCFTDCAKKC